MALNRVTYLRQQAADFRQMADRAEGPDFKAAHLQMAAEYERLADNAERLQPAGAKTQ